MFQPHRYSRTQVMYEDFASALLQSDKVLILEIYSAFEQPISGISAQMVVNSMHKMAMTR